MAQIPTRFLKYSRWDVISAFHKELRRGDVEKATYWLQVMIDGGAPNGYLSNYLWQIAAEELAPTEFETVNYIAWVRNFSSNIFPYHLYYATHLFCKAKKWWEDEDGTELRKLWASHSLDIKKAQAGEADFRTFPDYVHDKHTSEGKRRIGKGEADRRLEGSWAGMVFRREAHELTKDDPERDWKDVEWAEVWERDEAEGQLEFWDFMEKDVC